MMLLLCICAIAALGYLHNAWTNFNRQRSSSSVWTCLAYKPYFLVNEQYFSLTPNQPTVLSAMTYQSNKFKRTRPYVQQQCDADNNKHVIFGA